MMILAAVIILIAINCSAKPPIHLPVTVTIVLLDGEKGPVTCKGTDMYDQKERTGVLFITSVGQTTPLPLDFLRLLATSLQNDVIATSYYSKKPLRVQISMSTESPGAAISNPAVGVSDGLQILPNIQGSLVSSNPLDHENWNVNIPYYRPDEIVPLTEHIAELTVRNGWNQVFDCTITRIAAGGPCGAIKIKKENVPENFMEIKNFANEIFVEHEEKVIGESAEQKQTTWNIFYQVSNVNMQELDGKHYYAELQFQIEDIIIVTIMTNDATYPVRFVCGLGNKEKNQIVFFRGSRVFVPSTDKEGEYVDVTYGVAWAFTDPTSLQVTKWEEGEVDFSEIANAELENTELQHANGGRTIMVLPWRAASEVAIIPD